jgi:hypothetical protein
MFNTVVALWTSGCTDAWLGTFPDAITWAFKMISMHAILKTLKATKVRVHLKPSKLLLYFVVLLLAQCNDIESNPGPSNDSTKYMV